MMGNFFLKVLREPLGKLQYQARLDAYRSSKNKIYLFSLAWVLFNLI